MSEQLENGRDILQDLVNVWASGPLLRDPVTSEDLERNKALVAVVNRARRHLASSVPDEGESGWWRRPGPDVPIGTLQEHHGRTWRWDGRGWVTALVGKAER